MKLQPDDKYFKTFFFLFWCKEDFRSRGWREIIFRLKGSREREISRHKPNFSTWQFCLGPILFIFTWAQITRNWGQRLVLPSAWRSRTYYRERGRQRHTFVGVFSFQIGLYDLCFPNTILRSVWVSLNFSPFTFLQYFPFSYLFFFTFLLQAVLLLLILDLHHGCGKWREGESINLVPGQKTRHLTEGMASLLAYILNLLCKRFDVSCE